MTDFEQGLLWFDGDSYEPELDEERLGNQQRVVTAVMMDMREHTLAELLAIVLAELGKGSEAAVSARVRDLRKKRLGSWIVRRRRVTQGLYSYRVMGRKNGHE